MLQEDAFNPNWWPGLAVGVDSRGKSYAEPLESLNYVNRIRYVKNADGTNVQVYGEFFEPES